MPHNLFLSPDNTNPKQIQSERAVRAIAFFQAFWDEVCQIHVPIGRPLEQQPQETSQMATDPMLIETLSS